MMWWLTCHELPWACGHGSWRVLESYLHFQQPPQCASASPPQSLWAGCCWVCSMADVEKDAKEKLSVRLSAEGSLQNIVIWEVQELTKWSVPSSGTQRSGKHVPGGLTRSLHLLCLLDFENQTRYGWKGKSGKALLLGPRSPECVCAEGVSVVYFWSSNDGKRWPLIFVTNGPSSWK